MIPRKKGFKNYKSSITSLFYLKKKPYTFNEIVFGTYRVIYVSFLIFFPKNLMLLSDNFTLILDIYFMLESLDYLLNHSAIKRRLQIGIFY